MVDPNWLTPKGVWSTIFHIAACIHLFAIVLVIYLHLSAAGEKICKGGGTSAHEVA